MSLKIPCAARDRAPEGVATFRIERLSRAFTKYHLADGRALHHFRREEPHSNPHDHPWSFDTEILSGGYIEEIFHIPRCGAWRSERVHRLPGQTYLVSATHIHRIVELPDGERWTLVRVGPHERATRFWRFTDIIRSRAWNRRR